MVTISLAGYSCTVDVRDLDFKVKKEKTAVLRYTSPTRCLKRTCTKRKLKISPKEVKGVTRVNWLNKNFSRL